MSCCNFSNSIGLLVLAPSGPTICAQLRFCHRGSVCVLEYAGKNPNLGMGCSSHKQL